MHDPIASEYRGWWRITETSQWSSRFLDSLGPALALAHRAWRSAAHALPAGPRELQVEEDGRVSSRSLAEAPRIGIGSIFPNEVLP